MFTFTKANVEMSIIKSQYVNCLIFEVATYLGKHLTSKYKQKDALTTTVSLTFKNILLCQLILLMLYPRFLSLMLFLLEGQIHQYIRMTKMLCNIYSSLVTIKDFSSNFRF